LINFSAATGFGTLKIYNSGGSEISSQPIGGALINLPTTGASFIIR
jgi:hypothetical protein